MGPNEMVIRLRGDQMRNYYNNRTSGVRILYRIK